MKIYPFSLETAVYQGKNFADDQPMYQGREVLAPGPVRSDVE